MAVFFKELLLVISRIVYKDDEGLDENREEKR